VELPTFEGNDPQGWIVRMTIFLKFKTSQNQRNYAQPLLTLRKCWPLVQILATKIPEPFLGRSCINTARVGHYLRDWQTNEECERFHPNVPQLNQTLRYRLMVYFFTGLRHNIQN